MRVLVLGVTGMLGNRLWLEATNRYETWGTVRAKRLDELAESILGRPDGRLIRNFEASRQDDLEQAFDLARPDVAVNCIGIVKQRPEAADPVVSIGINSLFPHRLSRTCELSGCRLIHVSTDCVFSGREGGYSESSTPDATDLYGRSKLLGEVTTGAALTIRTSIVGHELREGRGLLAWFRSEAGKRIRGFTEAYFSGVTTIVLSRLLLEVAERHRDLAGLYHIAGDRISKHDLLMLFAEEFRAETEIAPDPSVRIDRSLDDSRFRTATGWVPPDWRSQVKELAQEKKFYDV